MKYFRMRQDQRYDRVPDIRNLYYMLDVRNFTPQKASKIEDRNIVFASTAYSQDYVDVLDRQIYLVSEPVKKVFEVYEPAVQYKLFCIINNTTNEFGKYYAPIFPEVDALSAHSETNRNRSFIKKLVLKESAVSDYGLCKIANLLTTVIVVRADVAESILRRNPKGIQFIAAEFEK